MTAAARREQRASGRRSAQQAESVDENAAQNGGTRAPGGAVTGKSPRTKGAKTSQHKAGAARGGATTAPKGAPTPARDRKLKGPSLYERFVRYLREVVGELRKVVWPNRKEMLTYTVVVLVFLILVTGFVFGIDLGFTKMMTVIFG
jgi:preprotein translocase subunit SecE